MIGASRPPTPTAEQRSAIQAGPRGAFLIAAGPGTGKTYTMVERFLWLVEEQRVPPTAILAVTFTDRAGAELAQRIHVQLVARGRKWEAAGMEEAWIGTFHAACTRLLRENAYLVGVPREIRVLDDIDQRLLKGRLQARLRSGELPGIDVESMQALNPDEVADLLKQGIDFGLKLKGRGIDPQEFRARALEIHAGHNQGAEHDGPEQLSAQAEREAIEILHTVYQAYETWLHEAGLMDFDDLILVTNQALRQVPEFRSRCRQAFRHLLVDEFQDSNRIQLELIRLLAADDFGNVSVVGDAKQSIYGWRDADIENIRSRFPGERLPLTHNRRSYQEILDLATDFIQHDPDFADEPQLVAGRGAGGRRVSVVMAADSQREARMVAAEIRALADGGLPFSEIAVLAHSVKHLPREFEEALRQYEVPYVTSGGSGFFDREEVKDVLAFLRLVADPMDDGALVRALQGPIVRLEDADMYRLASRRLRPEPRWGMRLRDCLDESAAENHAGLDPGAAARAGRVLAVTDRLGQARDALTVADVLNRLLEETGYLRHCQLRAAREGPRALLNLRKVFRMASRFERDATLAGLGDFVGHLDQIMDAVVPIGEAEVEAAEAVRLLTIHGAKGLEFPVVFLVNLRPPVARESEKIFFDPDGFGFVMKWWRNKPHPSYQAAAPGQPAVKLALEERRRAVYVALTRAADRLYVSATRDEPSAEEIGDTANDHFAEIVRWARDHPEAAQVIEAEQLDLPSLLASPAPGPSGTAALVEAVAERLEQLRPAAPRSQPPAVTAVTVTLSFSHLHQFELCPVRYRFLQSWKVPAPPDELLSAAARAGGGPELGACIHEALQAHHSGGGGLLELYCGPDAGAEMLRRYLEHPLAAAPTLGVEIEFNLRLGPTRLKGLVDRVCTLEGSTALVDYKTNARLDARLLEAYSTQLRLYGLAATRGLLPGGQTPRLILFDLRRAEAIEVAPDPIGVESRVLAAAARIEAGDYTLGPEHAQRPCFLCAYRPLCKDARP